MSSRAYEYADVVQEKVTAHLKSLGFDVSTPPKKMTIQRKVDLLNYLRAVRTTCEVVEDAVIEYPEFIPVELKSV